MATQSPFLNVQLPFTGSIKGGLYEGKSITMTGRVLPGAERFNVNLQCGPQGSADVAFHFNPRYNESSDTVVCNTRAGSSWGSEERSHKMPLPRGYNFTLTFLVNRDSYSVIVNGVHFMEYKHRLSASRVNAISVNGGVEIQSISFQNPVVSTPAGFGNMDRRRQPKGSMRHCAPKNAQVQSIVQPCFASPGLCAAPPPYSAPVSYAVPYKQVMQGGFYPGKTIMVQGFINHDADKFCINFRYNSGVAFHFNPRFNENVVVRNSLLDQCWGAEERAGGMPFYRGQPFTLTITCDTQCYRIMVNGVQMFTYNHRYFLFQQIDILEVEGKLSISSVMA